MLDPENSRLYHSPPVLDSDDVAEDLGEPLRMFILGRYVGDDVYAE